MSPSSAGTSFCAFLFIWPPRSVGHLSGLPVTFVYMARSRREKKRQERIIFCFFLSIRFPSVSYTDQ